MGVLSGPLHERAAVAGVSEACCYCDHEQCRASTCSCDCHKPTVIEQSVSIISQVLEKACPKCGSKRPFIETFCRIDGERLASLLCGVCGSGMNVEDGYCYNCGSPKGKVAEAEANGSVTVPQGDVDYGQMVLKGLQDELGGNNEKSNLGVQMEEVQRVVDRPAGKEGSFKLVSQPSPNRIRGPVASPESHAQGTQPSVPVRRVPKLPIKPA